MDKRILWILPGILLLTAACSITFNGPSFSANSVRGSGNVKTETRSVSNFDEVDLTGSGDLTIQLGDQESLKIEAEDNLLPVLTSDVVGRRLDLGVKRGTSISPTRPIRYTLTVKSLKAVSLLGSGSITGSGFDTDSFSVSVLGSGDVNLDKVNFKTLDVRIAGSGNITMNGTANSQTVNIPGSAEYRAGNLQSQSGNVTISGSGNATVWTSDTLDIRITGSGTVEYYGSPKVSQKITGSGNIRSLGNK